MNWVKLLVLYTNNKISEREIKETRDYHTKLSKSDRKRQVSYAITYMWNIKKKRQMNLFTKQKQTHRHRKQTYGYKGDSGGEGRDKLGVWD